MDNISTGRVVAGVLLVVAAIAVWCWLLGVPAWRAYRAHRALVRERVARHAFEGVSVVTDTGVYRWSDGAWHNWPVPVEPGKRECVQDVRELRRFATITSELLVQDPEFASRIRRINP